jgi:putative chitinase
MIDITATIRAVAPHADAVGWAGFLSDPMDKANINTPNRIAAFLPQVAVESAYFTRISELDNYTTAERIRFVFPDEFPADLDITPYVNNPEALANRAYAEKNGNGNEASGDGWMFRGRGLIQITGRANYEAFASAMGITLAQAAAFAATNAGAAASACWYWTMRRLNPLADSAEINAITRLINPAMEGAADRLNLWHVASVALGKPTAAHVPTLMPPAPVAPPEDEADALDSEFNPGV